MGQLLYHVKINNHCIWIQKKFCISYLGNFLLCNPKAYFLCVKTEKTMSILNICFRMNPMVEY